MSPTDTQPSKEGDPAPNTGGCKPIPQNSDQEELSKILRNLCHDPEMLGIFHLGRDGIFRSLTADREVVDAVPFTPKLIDALFARLPECAQQEELRGLDGTNVPKEQWFNPDKSMLPPPMSQEAKEEGRKKMEENKEKIDEARKRMKFPEIWPRKTSFETTGLEKPDL